MLDCKFPNIQWDSHDKRVILKTSMQSQVFLFLFLFCIVLYCIVLGGVCLEGGNGFTPKNGIMPCNELGNEMEWFLFSFSVSKQNTFEVVLFLLVEIGREREPNNPRFIKPSPVCQKVEVETSLSRSRYTFESCLSG